MLLLQEFDIEIKDKSGKENLVTDHLSRIVQPEDATPIRDTFPYEHLFAIRMLPWYTNIFNFMVMGKFPPNITMSHRDKIKKDAKRYIWNEPYLWKHCADQVIRRCVEEHEV